MTASNWAKAYDRERVYEGGNVDDPRDPGGRTSRGMRRQAWREVRYGVLDEFTPVGSVVLLDGEELDGLSGAGWIAVDKRTAFNNIEGVQEQQSTVDALRYVGLLIGGMVVGIFFYVITLQKISQLGMLKAIGAPGGYLLRQGLIQVVLITLIMVSSVKPALAPETSASALAVIRTLARRLFTSFIAWPMPSRCLPVNLAR